MKSKHRLFALVLSFLMAPGIPALAQDSFALLTPEETATWVSFSQATRGISLIRSDGPKIKVNAPSGFALASPVTFDIEILPRDGVAPEISTLKIEYSLGPVWTDVTKRIRKHATMSGSRFQAPGAELPAGKHRLRLSIADAQGRVTAADIQFTVSN